jgi:hypothetical protein
MTLDELSKTVEFRSLSSAKMARWVSLYVQSYIDTGMFEMLPATKAVYVGRSDENLRIRGYHLRKNPKVKAIVGLFLNAGKRDIDLDLEEIQKHLDAAMPGSVSAQRLLSMKMSIKRGIQPEEPETAGTNVPANETPQTSPAAVTQPWKIGDRLTERDDAGVLHTGIVRTLDADGEPDDIEAVE